MKNQLKLIALGVFFSLSGCQDFLKEENIAGISGEFYNTDTGVESALDAAYVYLRDPFQRWGGEAHQRIMVYGTDEFIPAVGYSGDWQNYSINSMTGEVRDLWARYYQAINICNVVVTRMPQVPFGNKLKSEKEKNAKVAEARFLRAYYYYTLVLTFGNIPLLMEENNKATTDYKRASVSKVFEAMIEDLTFAEIHLPETHPQHGRVTKGAAQHFLAKVYLTRASGVAEDRGKQPGDLDQAIAYAKKCIETGTYRLEDDVLDVFAYNGTGPENSEVMLAVQFTQDLLLNGGQWMGNQSHFMWTNNPLGLSNYFQKLTLEGGWNYVKIKPSEYLLDLYDSRYDSRFYKWHRTTWRCNIPQPTDSPIQLGDTIVQYVMVDTPNELPDYIRNSDYYKYGKVYTRSEFSQAEFPSTLKHVDPHRRSASDFAGHRDEPLIRLGETYLIAAEAYGRKGDYTNAVEYLNVLRKRAAYKAQEEKPVETYAVHGLPESYRGKGTENEMLISVDEINSTEKLVDFILDERARELNGEFLRWLDLVRTETWYERVKQHNGDVYYNMKPFHRFRPIPQTHINSLSNPGPIEEEQNPGYY